MLVDRARAETLVFRLARQERDVWVTWPSRVAAEVAAARVGMLESEAKEAGHDVEVRFTDTGGWYSNYRIGETSPSPKIVMDRSDGRILGAHPFGPEYSEPINILGLAMKLKNSCNKTPTK